MRHIACAGLFLLAMTCSTAQSQTPCDRASGQAIAFGNVAHELCFGRIDPEAEHHEITVLETCLSKCQETLIRVSEAENACMNAGDEVLAEIAKFRGHVTDMMRMVDLMKRMEEGTVTTEEALVEMLLHPE